MHDPFSRKRPNTWERHRSSAGASPGAAPIERDPPRAHSSTGNPGLLSAGPSLHNHIPDPDPAAAEMVRAARAGGTVGAYVRDYHGEMQLLRHFWEAVAATDADAATHDTRSHHHICEPDPRASLFRSAGLSDVDAIDLPMRFRERDDFRRPHTRPGTVPAMRYVSTLADGRKTALREQLRVMPPTAADGTIDLIGRAWTVRGTKRTI